MVPQSIMYRNFVHILQRTGNFEKRLTFCIKLFYKINPTSARSAHDECSVAKEEKHEEAHDDHHHPEEFVVKPSRFQHKKFMDMLHGYALVGVIVGGIVVFCSNVFIGPATLTPVPEDYVPKHWEYHKHPISRFLSRYIYPSPQQEYEKMLHFLYEENEKALIRQLEGEIRDKMASRNDYQAYYYRPALGKYFRISKEVADENFARFGD